MNRNGFYDEGPKQPARVSRLEFDDPPRARLWERHPKDPSVRKTLWALEIVVLYYGRSVLLPVPIRSWKQHFQTLRRRESLSP